MGKALLRHSALIVKGPSLIRLYLSEPQFGDIHDTKIFFSPPPFHLLTQMRCYIFLVSVFSVFLGSSVTAAPTSKIWSDVMKAISGLRFGLATATSIHPNRSQIKTSPSPRLGSEFSTESLPRQRRRGKFGNHQLLKRVFGTSRHSKVILPLTKVSDNQHLSSLHPHIAHQLRVNRALRRHARFSDLSIRDDELIEGLRRRADSIGFDLKSTHHHPQKRRFSLHPARGWKRAIEPNATTDIPAMRETVASGYSPKKLDALINHSITSPGNPTAANSVGFGIEANDVAYFTTIEVGTPPESFKVIMDSGSSDFWLSGPRCSNSDTGAGTCGHKTLSAASKSFKASDVTFQVAYGTGRVAGFLVQEDVSLAGLELVGHKFGGTTSETDDFAGDTVPFDGLMGTALSTLSNQNLLTPIESLAKAGTIPRAMIGYALGRSSETSNNGEVTVGGVDESRFEGSLKMIENVSSRGFWEGEMGTVSVDGNTVLQSKTAIFDTGTTLIICPPNDAQAVHAAIRGAKSDGQGGFTLPCVSQVRLSLGFGGKEFEINPKDLTVQPVNQNDLTGDCMSGIVSGQIGGPDQWLLGDVFLKSVYFATDATNNQIGLGAIKLKSRSS